MEPEIVYLESIGDYVKIQTETIVTRETISNIESKLTTENFVRIHRSFIVSISHITSYTNEYVEVPNQAIAISRSHRNKFIEQMEGVP